jgi:hypothetical protein
MLKIHVAEHGNHNNVERCSRAKPTANTGFGIKPSDAHNSLSCPQKTIPTQQYCLTLNQNWQEFLPKLRTCLAKIRTCVTDGFFEERVF